MRTLRRGAALLLAVLAVLLLGAGPAAAHPLGNFSVNSHSGLRVEPTAVRVAVVVDSAEIPTLQAFPEAATGVAEPEALAYRQRECARLAEGAELTIDGRRTPLTVTASALDFPEGSAGLRTTRLSCSLSAEGVDTVGRALAYRDTTALDRVGWREITAVGDGVRLVGSDVPEQSSTGVLTAYPEDLLASPLDQRAATMTVAAGNGVVSGAEAVPGAPADGLTRGVDGLTAAYTRLVSANELTFGFGVVAVLLAAVLGSLHAFAPGHGKALMAASLVGRTGTLRQAAVIGASVTVTHTLGVLVLGLVLSVTSLTAPERVYPWLGLVSGVLLVAIGLTLLRSALLRPAPLFAVPQVPLAPELVPAHGHGSDHGHSHSHDHSHDHVHDEGAEHEHPHHDHSHHEPRDHSHHQPHDHSQHEPHDHPHHDHTAADHAAVSALEASLPHQHGPFGRMHTHEPVPAGMGTRSLLAVGFTGGLVPSPSALLVLLGGVALGRAWFGVVLVLAYGVGMAAALVGTGLALVRARDRIEAWAQRLATAGRGRLLRVLARALPAATAALVVLVGLGVAFRGAAGI